jgi:hypothetical protein
LLVHCAIEAAGANFRRSLFVICPVVEGSPVARGPPPDPIATVVRDRQTIKANRFDTVETASYFPLLFLQQLKSALGEIGAGSFQPRIK